MRTLMLFLLTAGSAGAQLFSGGIKVGVPLTDFFSTVENVSSSVPNRFVGGLTGELHLPFGFGIELDALYRRMHYDSSVGRVVAGVNNDRVTANGWEFPLVAKYRFPAKIVRPYVEAGVAFDKLSGVTDTIVHSVNTVVTSTTSTSSPDSLQNTSTKGFVIGAGINVHVLLIHISPEIRYTRWGAQHFNLNGVINSNQNQAEFLVGITF